MSKKTTAKRKYVRTSEPTWAEIEALWETGDVTLAELEVKFQVSRRTLQSRFAKRGVAKGSKAAALAAAVKKAVFDKTLPDEHLTKSRAKDTREAAYRNAVVIEDLIMGQLTAAQKDPTQALRAASAIKALSLAAAGLERLHALKWRALGMDSNTVDPEELPKLIFVDLTEADVAEFRRKNGHNENDVFEEASIVPDQNEDGVGLDDGEIDHDEDDDVVEIGFDDPIEVKPQVDKAGCRMVRGA